MLVSDELGSTGKEVGVDSWLTACVKLFDELVTVGVDAETGTWVLLVQPTKRQRKKRFSKD